ncbi:MAG: 3-isopropylmalate dehydratase [Candidatus Omnitrophica bacterium]|nr:3-isopropylmalate dehydratase [Candidatus Omnitrophota bacterium]
MKNKKLGHPRGLAHRLRIRDHINTDYIISGRYKFRIRDPKDLAKYVFNDLDPEFHKKVKKGDFLIAGENFGCGSSREQAPLALKALGIKAVIAKSFARIFYRNSFNIGLMLIECNTQFIDDGDILELDEEKNIIKNVNKGLNIDIKSLPLIIKKILEDGGVVEHFRKHKGFKIES